MLVMPAVAQSQAAVGLFDRAAALDLTAATGGRFLYAIDFGGTEATAVGSVVFTPDATTEGLTVSSSETIAEWGEPNHFGESPADLGLAEVLHGMRWTPHSPSLIFSLTGLDPAAGHHLQLLFTEKCCDRGFDVLVNGEVIVPRFSPRQVTGDDLTKGAVISLVLDPGIEEVEVLLRGAPTHFPDPTPVIQAATLEELPSEDQATAMAPLLTLRQTPSHLQLSWPSTVGDVYRIQYSQEMTAETWIDLEQEIEGDGALLSFRDTNPARRAKFTGFYRIVYEIGR